MDKWRSLRMPGSSGGATTLSQEIAAMIALPKPCFLHDVTYAHHGNFGDDDVRNTATLESELAHCTWPLPPRRASDMRPLYVCIYLTDFNRRVLLLRTCGYASPGTHNFNLSSLPPNPPPAPLPPPQAVAKDDQVATFRLPVLRGAFSMMDSGQTFGARQLLATARHIVTLLPPPDAPDTPDDIVLPTEGWTGCPIPPAAEWDAALLLLVASVCRSPRMVARIAGGYATLVRACGESDGTFLRRMAACNVTYAGCAAAEMMALQAEQTVQRNADELRGKYHSMRATVRCFALLLDEDDEDKTNNDT